MVGIDYDPGMLALLQKHLAPHLEARVRLLIADIAHIPLVEQYGLIIMPCNTLSTLSRDAQAGLINEARRLLAQDGVFAVSLTNPELLRGLPSLGGTELEEAFPHPVSGEPVQVSSGWKKTAKSLEITWHYDHLLPDGGVERLTSRVQHRLDTMHDYQQAFSSAGLHVAHLYGDFDGSAYQPDSDYLIILAQPAAF
jgi:SAM-dependent methyltransferase